MSFISIIVLLSIACDQAPAAPDGAVPDVPGPDAEETDEDEEASVGDAESTAMGGTSTGFGAEYTDAESSGGWEPLAFDLGGGAWEPAYDCDDANSIVPEGVACADALPGDEAPADVHEAVAEAFGPSCVLERTCAEQWGIDCQSAVDGPYHYVKAETLELIATCGGACQAQPCDECPPQGWNCPIY